LKKIDTTSHCWIWTSTTNNKGYGRFSVNAKPVLAHRFSYELFKGDIPTGMELDHLCRNPKCVNPNHLEAVTHKENGLRGNSGLWQKLKMHCPKGHPLKEPNLVKRKHSHPGRECKVCHNLQEKVRKHN